MEGLGLQKKIFSGKNIWEYGWAKMHEIVEEQKFTIIALLFSECQKDCVKHTSHTYQTQDLPVTKSRKRNLSKKKWFIQFIVNKQGFCLYFQQVWATNFFLRRAELFK